MRDYEELDIISLDAREDIADTVIKNVLGGTAISVISDKDLVDYVLQVLISIDDVSIFKIDMSMDDDIEYILSVDENSSITLLPLDDYDVLHGSDKFFVDMDGSVHQDIIDELLSLDKDVVLFGIEDDEELQDGCSHSVYVSRKKDGTPLGFTRSWSVTDNNGCTECSSYSVYSDSLDRLNELAEMFNVKL